MDEESPPQPPAAARSFNSVEPEDVVAPLPTNKAAYGPVFSTPGPKQQTLPGSSAAARGKLQPPHFSSTQDTAVVAVVGRPQFAKAPRFTYTPRREAATGSRARPPMFSSTVPASSVVQLGFPSKPPHSSGFEIADDVVDDDLDGGGNDASPSAPPRTRRRSDPDIISTAGDDSDGENSEGDARHQESRKRRRLTVDKSDDYDGDDIEDVPDEEMADGGDDALDEIETDEDDDDAASSMVDGEDGDHRNPMDKAGYSQGGVTSNSTTTTAAAGLFKTPARPAARGFQTQWSSASLNKGKYPVGKSPFAQFSTPLPAGQHSGFPVPIAIGPFSASKLQQQQQQSAKPLVNFLTTPKFFKVSEQESPYEPSGGGDGAETRGPIAAPGGFISGIRPNLHMPPVDWSPSHRRHKSASSKYKPGGLASTALRWVFDANDQVLRAGYVATGGEQAGLLKVVDVKRMDTYLAVRGRPVGDGDWWRGTEAALTKPPSAPKFLLPSTSREDGGKVQQEDQDIDLLIGDQDEREDEDGDVSLHLDDDGDGNDNLVNLLLVNDTKTPWTNRISPGVRVIIGEPHWVTNLQGKKWIFVINWDVLGLK